MREEQTLDLRLAFMKEFTKDEKELALLLYREGLTQTEIAHIRRKSQPTISRWLKELR